MKESLIVPKWELAWNLKKSNNAQRLLTHSDLSVDRSENEYVWKHLFVQNKSGKMLFGY